MSWQTVTLGQVSELLIGFAFKSAGFLDTDSDGIKLVRGDNVQQGTIRWGDKAKKWSREDVNELSRYQLRLGDVILAMDRPIVGGGLKLAWITENDLPSLLVQRVCCVRGKAGIADTLYLRYVLSHPQFSGHIERITTGANIPHISGRDIATYSFSLPLLNEQQRIAGAIAAYDDLIENNQRRIKLLEEAARRLYREWFVALRFPGHERVKMVDGVPQGWERVTFEDLATLNYGKALKESVRTPGNVPVYGSSGIVGTHNSALVDGQAIIVGRKGNVGSVFLSDGPFFAIDTVYYIAPQQTSFYLFLLLQTLHFISSDSAVPGLNRSYAYSLPALNPTADVREKFEKAVQPLFTQIGVLERSNSAAKQARDALLPQLMSGALSV